MKKRYFVLFVFAWLILSWSILASDDIVVKLDVKIPMRDGIQLSTNSNRQKIRHCFISIATEMPSSG
jgi:hypothetical protein